MAMSDFDFSPATAANFGIATLPVIMGGVLFTTGVILLLRPLVIAVLSSASFFTIIPADLAKDRGLNPSSAVYVLQAFSVADIAFKAVTGVAIDSCALSHESVMIAGYVVQVVAYEWLVWVNTFPHFMAASVLMGATYGSRWCLQAPILVRDFGITTLPVTMGGVLFSGGVALLLRPLIIVSRPRTGLGEKLTELPLTLGYIVSVPSTGPGEQLPKLALQWLFQQLRPGTAWIRRVVITLERDSQPTGGRAGTAGHAEAAMPVVVGMLQTREVAVLRDTGSNIVLVRQSMVPEKDITCTGTPVLLVDGIARRMTVARGLILTAYYWGWIEARCAKHPLYAVILRNVPGVRRMHDPDPLWSLPTTTHADVAEFQPPKVVDKCDERCVVQHTKKDSKCAVERATRNKGEKGKDGTKQNE
ncbi:hypothetical protein HPB52_018785 [Rhipicephalus sanguineus]|uniref:Uncharacterized protein n=1 Tax=Rhipicephalus sanguineus TaxID=34632 RepID=A0A9D4PLA7_RHISA|nr:hypothetical protein HPB52_018785 [Rhipicephalus sanguineus]